MQFKPSLLSLTIASVLAAPTLAVKAEALAVEEQQIEVINVTATRRSGTVQDAPLNITALDNDVIAQQNISELADIARWVPGLTITDQGGREASPIIVRGLNTNSSGPGSDGGTVSTYIGELPAAVDLKLVDVERVEVLIGPQGTLYGAGTLGGAIRYILNKPETDVASASVFGDLSSTNESDSLGKQGGFIVNFPLINDTLALRASLNYLNDPGYIDYNYMVREPGVSLTDPDWSNSAEVAANTYRKADANGEQTTTGRIALRWTPNDWLDSTLNYYFQNEKIEGRGITHYDALGEANPLKPLIGKYESAYRYEEPNDIDNSLLSLEVTADLGFAELVSATGLAKTEEHGQRDQTDLLIRLNYGYEEFPAFSAFTREDQEKEVFTQELRLVSTGDSDWNWIVGAFYNQSDFEGYSREFTPGFDQYALTEWETGGNPRPDALEYISVDDTTVTEKAIFGELGYQMTEQLAFTIGARFYDYDVKSRSAIDLPLYNSVFDGAPSDAITLDFKDANAEDSGNLLKFNTNYKFTPDVMGYFTVSEGFRIGGSNGVAPCPVPLPEDRQIVCALPDERIFTPDMTTNYELGFKTTWFKNKLHFNAAVFNVDWEDAQVSGATVNGQQPIITNAASANAKGVEISARAILPNGISTYATYAYTRAELTSDAPFLFAVVDDQGTDIQNFYDGKDGDRLPGSPENQFSLGLNYETEVLNGKQLDLTYGLTYQSDVISKVGLRADGETLPGYALSNIAAKLADDRWSVTFYVDNLFDKYAFTSVRRDKGDTGLATFPDRNVNDPALQRNYGHFILTPMTVGMKFNYQFEI
ncbi:TonB-dependent receptor [Rheinheimera soli]|uniref:Outer membrane receptor protein involved in Fe transport n=1 Tax=Rheinheimera soli TaxID=443616 RepID=A0ABU1VXQ7_9GAMM|nr:TonB-dependent receptor [Rheinheimera soli]MDR7120173.1 outer membrane receptor protein involved in Fe transport [Rheinheimera soli]